MPAVMASMSWVDAFIPLCCLAGFAFSLFLFVAVKKVRVGPAAKAANGAANGKPLLAAEVAGDDGVRRKAQEIQEAIQEGADSFLYAEYFYMFGFMLLFSVLLLALLGSGNGKGSTPYGKEAMTNAIFTTVAFILGAVTSTVAGFIGMKIATYANARTALEARGGVDKAFVCAFQSGAIMGLMLTSVGLLVLYAAIRLFGLKYGAGWVGLYEAIAGYGLGGSAMALFGRVGGGIYTKAADVGADLVGKVEQDIPEDDPRNPGTIADNVGDNVGDVAGMSSDLFGSFAESTCAALVVSSLSSMGGTADTGDHDWSGIMFPLLITAVGILVSIFTTLFATHLYPASDIPSIEPVLKFQLQLSTALMVAMSFLLGYIALPIEFTLPMPDGHEKPVQWWMMSLSVTLGLVAGYVIGHFTEVYTSNTYKHVVEVADACKTGAATNIIYGLALGYKSCIIPAACMAVVIFGAFSMAGMYGIACAALGMLGTLSTCLAIDAYGPIADNAGGIAEMAEMGHEIRERTDALDAAGNTTAAIGKGFAIGSAALVSLALFGAFITRAEITIQDASILNAKVFPGLVLGAMLPYWFSAMTMKAVGKAALEMVEEIRRQFREIPGIMEGTAKPEYKECVLISTKASIAEMIAPGVLVLGTPIAVGVLFGTQTLAGVLTGALISGVQMATSAANTGGAWDNAKKYLEAGNTEHAREIGGKGTEAHKAAVTGDTVGDPLKDTSGPALNILIKLMAVESLVFAPFFAAHTKDGLIFQLFGL